MNATLKNATQRSEINVFPHSAAQNSGSGEAARRLPAVDCH
jgi:hypothetical protein